MRRARQMSSPSLGFDFYTPYLFSSLLALVFLVANSSPGPIPLDFYVAPLYKIRPGGTTRSPRLRVTCAIIGDMRFPFAATAID